MAPKRLLLLAASVVAALDANAPPSLVSDYILQWLRENTVEDDFVALKFDVDNDSLGPTMEWGFLADLLRRPEALALADVAQSPAPRPTRRALPARRLGSSHGRCATRYYSLLLTIYI